MMHPCVVFDRRVGCCWGVCVLQVAEVERVVTEGVELLVHRPLEVSPFNEDEPQMLRHASTREAFVRLVHYFLLLADVSFVAAPVCCCCFW